MNTILIKHSTVPGRVPDNSELQVGELSVNCTDGILYFKSSDECNMYKIDAKRSGKLDVVKEATSLCLKLVWLMISVVILVNVFKWSVSL
jgi:hypothetical protein